MREQLTYLLQNFGDLAIFAGLWLDGIVAAAPGETLLILAAFYAGISQDSPWTIYLWGVLGAWLGSYTSFIIGNKLGHSQSTLLYKMGITPDRKAKLHKLMERYGSWVLVVARFIPGSRQVVFYLAGMGGMPVWKFHVATLAGIVPWAGLAVYAGYAVRGQWEQALHLFREYGFVAGLLAVAGIAGFVVWSRYYKQKSPLDQG